MNEFVTVSESRTVTAHGIFNNITTRQKGNTYYKDFTLTEEAKELYAKEYGYEESEFMAG